MLLGLSHFADQKFRHNFQDCLEPTCSCGLEIRNNHPFPPSLPHIVQGKPFLGKLTVLLLTTYHKSIDKKRFAFRK